MLSLINFIISKTKLPEKSINNTVDLLNQDATIPFISRYRKEMTGNLDEVQIGDIVKYKTLFEDLEKLHKKYKDQGLVVLGFPSDDFFQEEDDEKDTAKVCFVNYGVTFNMLATSDVRGDSANPIFKHLGDKTSSPKWNFYKYLVSADRQTITRFNSRTKPLSDEMVSAVEKALQ